MEAAVFRVFEQCTVHLRGQGNFQKLLSWFKFKMTISFRKQSCLKNAYKASLCVSTFPTAGKFELFFAFLKTIAGILGQRVNISFLVSRLYLLAYIFTVVWMYHFFFLWKNFNQSHKFRDPKYTIFPWMLISSITLFV